MTRQVSLNTVQVIHISNDIITTIYVSVQLYSSYWNREGNITTILHELLQFMILPVSTCRVADSVSDWHQGASEAPTVPVRSSAVPERRPLRARSLTYAAVAVCCSGTETRHIRC